LRRLKPGFGRLASLDEAFSVLFDHVPVLAVEEVELGSALNRVLANDVVSEIDVPQFRKSAMDGYAVEATQTFGASDKNPKCLSIVEAINPGRPGTAHLGQGACAEIGTGAVLPEGADSVVMVEYTEPEGDDMVRVRRAVAPGENVIQAASDVESGTTVLKAKTFLGPRHLGILAAIGATSVQVVARPRVALFSSGGELVWPGTPLAAGQVYDINSYTLRAALGDDGCEVVDLGIIPDDIDALKAALRKGLDEADIVVGSGGSSLGSGDLMVEAFGAEGRIAIHGVAVKPGKPLVVAIAERSGSGASPDTEKLMIGLPGYPVSALCDYYLFIQAVLYKAMGIEAKKNLADAVLARKYPSSLGRYEFLPVALQAGQALPLTGGSSAISTLSRADGFVEINENTEVVEAGARVVVRLF